MMVFRQYQTAVEQIIGREGETATLLKRSLVSLTMSVSGFAHVNSIVSPLRAKPKRMEIYEK
jgi:hypothetical protein